jgi:hypothetical protein
MLIVTPQRNSYVVAFYGARAGKTFDYWSSKPMSHARAIRLKLRIERRHRRVIRAARDAERARLIAEIKAAWPRFAPGLPPAVELMARFGKNQLEMLDDDMLRRVRLAIAM